MVKKEFPVVVSPTASKEMAKATKQAAQREDAARAMLNAPAPPKRSLVLRISESEVRGPRGPQEAEIVSQRGNIGE